MIQSNFLQIISVLGLSGIIGSCVSYWLSKKKEIEFEQREQKMARYKSALLFMDAYLEPKNISYLNQIHPVIKNERDVKEWLKAEYREIILFADKKTVIATSSFINNPTQESFTEVILSMRQDVLGKRNRLSSKQIELK